MPCAYRAWFIIYSYYDNDIINLANITKSQLTSQLKLQVAADVFFLLASGGSVQGRAIGDYAPLLAASRKTNYSMYNNDIAWSVFYIVQNIAIQYFLRGYTYHAPDSFTIYMYFVILQIQAFSESSSNVLYIQVFSDASKAKQPIASIGL